MGLLQGRCQWQNSRGKAREDRERTVTSMLSGLACRIAEHSSNAEESCNTRVYNEAASD